MLSLSLSLAFLLFASSMRLQSHSALPPSSLPKIRMKSHFLHSHFQKQLMGFMPKKFLLLPLRRLPFLERSAILAAADFFLPSSRARSLPPRFTNSVPTCAWVGVPKKLPILRSALPSLRLGRETWSKLGEDGMRSGPGVGFWQVSEHLSTNLDNSQRALFYMY